MRQLGSLLVLPAAVAFAASGDGNGINSQASLGRVQVTLQSLLRNIQDTGRHAEKALKQRHLWCEGASASYAEKEEAMRTDVEHLRLDLLEQEAALEEAEGSLRERRAEIAMLEHTINMTASVLQDAKLNASLTKSQEHSEAERRLTALLQSRQQTVVSLQAELSALQPKASQLEAQVAEGRRQITDRSASSKTQASFGEAVRDSCQASLRSADKQAALRVAEAGAISKALQALELLGVAPATPSEKSSSDDAALAQGLAEVSFVQLKREHGKAATTATAAAASEASTESGEEQLYSLFGDDVADPSDASPPAAAAPTSSSASGSDSSAMNDDADEAEAAPESAWSPAVNAIAGSSTGGAASSSQQQATRDASEEDQEGEDDDEEEQQPQQPQQQQPPPRANRRALSAGGSVANVEQLLTSVKAEGQVEQTRRAWCSQEKASSTQRLQLAHDAVERAASETQMHSDMEAQLGEVLERLHGAQGEIGSAASSLAEDASKELSAIDAEVKDQDLATKILQQASKFLQESEAAQGEQNAGSSSKKAVHAAVQELAKAKKLFQAQEKLNQETKKETNARITSIKDVALEAKAALEKEANGLVLSRDSHASLRRRSEEEKGTREAETTTLQQFVQGLAKSCEAVTGGNSGSSHSGADAEERQQAAEMQVLEDAKKVLTGEKLSSSQTRSSNSGGLRGGAKAQLDTSKLSPLQRAALEMGLSEDGN